MIDNIFRIFDPDLTGSIRFNELLIAFSMSMRGTGELWHGGFVSVKRRKREAERTGVIMIKRKREAERNWNKEGDIDRAN